MYTVSISMLEIYNETVRDLLCTDERDREESMCSSLSYGSVTSSGTAASAATAAGRCKALDIRRSAEAGTYVEGLTSLELRTDGSEDFDAVLAAGCARRSTGATTMNERSSRSHLVVMVTVQSCKVVPGGGGGGTATMAPPVTAKMYLVDLAGSERIHAYDKVPERLRESQVCGSLVARPSTGQERVEGHGCGLVKGMGGDSLCEWWWWWWWCVSVGE